MSLTVSGKLIEPLGVVVGAAESRGQLVIDVDRASRPVASSSMPLQHRAEQFQPAEIVAVVDAARDRRRVDARLHALPADVEGPRREFEKWNEPVSVRMAT